MELRITKPQNMHMLVLVHGLNGSLESWEGTSERFIENLGEESLIQQNFDVYLFKYPTKIFELTKFKKIVNTVKGFIKNRPHEDVEGFNIGIDSVSRNLESDIRDVHHSYKSISFIAHSMGGLVVKSALTWMPVDILEKVRLIISLSVPHIGANLAEVGRGLLGNHPQIIDLKGMGEFTTTLNRRYGNLKPQPKIFYQHGNQDTVVSEAAAIFGTPSTSETLTTPDSHFSVLLIKDRTKSHLFRTIERELQEVIQPVLGIEIGIEDGISVQFILQVIASRLKIRIDYTALTGIELQAQLRKAQIQGKSAEELIGRIGEFTIQPFPAYIVQQVVGTSDYIIRKH